jgi:HAE1 family hydrophobic/amphiphilic exporter-1
VRNENQDLPVGAIRSLAQERVVQIDARMQRPEDFGRIIVARKGSGAAGRQRGRPVRIEQVARVEDGAQEVESLALYNGQRTLLLSVQKSQGENTIEVVDGLNAAVAALRAELPPGVRLETIGDSARPIRVAVDNVRQTLIEGAAAHGADRVSVPQLVALHRHHRSDAADSHHRHLFVHELFGFTINMITLMALSLCVGLLIDDAIVVRENIVRHVQMGKGAYQAAMEGTQEIGLAVLATTLSIVAVFLPIGFMGGIIGKFFHEFGITIVAAVLISMFVSFTLDPMLSSVWHDPSIHAHGQRTEPVSWYDKTIGRVTGWFDRATDALAEGYQKASCAGRWCTSCPPGAWRWASSC